MPAELVAMQRRHQRERSCGPHSPTNRIALPLNLPPIGSQDKVSYKPEEIIHLMAIDKQKALYFSDNSI
jgi:hypothetical protein